LGTPGLKYSSKSVQTKNQNDFKTNRLSDFRGNLTRGITGFYKSVYTNSRKERIPIAASKFQPTYARRAFPCIDEPSFKATFSVTLVRPTDRYIALSNMPVERETQSAPSIGYTEVKVTRLSF
jgi:aminopeptidase N